MHARWQQLAKLYHSLSLRERLLVAASVLVAVIVAWYMFVALPLLHASVEVQSQHRTLVVTVQKLSQQRNTLKLKLEQDPLHDLKQRVAQLNRQLVQNNKLLKQRLQGLIAPQQMADVLESVLKQHHDLKLLKVQSLPAEPLVPAASGNKSATDTPQVKQRIQVYRHGLELQLEGSYLATLAYLKALQSLQWDFYWDAVRLQVEKYPKAKVTIRVHTLSLTEGWIGV